MDTKPTHQDFINWAENYLQVKRNQERRLALKIGDCKDEDKKIEMQLQIAEIQADIAAKENYLKHFVLHLEQANG